MRFLEILLQVLNWDAAVFQPLKRYRSCDCIRYLSKNLFDQGPFDRFLYTLRTKSRLL